MRKTKAQEIRRLQKKLIPVNLLVCILCIVASLSLFFMPIVKINLATIVGDETLKKIVTDIAVEKINSFIDKAGDSIDGSLGGEDDGTGEGPEDKTDDENGGIDTQSEENGEESGSGETGGEGSEGGGTEGSENEGGSGEGSEGGNEGNESGGEEEVTIKDLLKEINVKELVSTLVNEIFDEVKADINVSAQNSLTVFMAKDKASTLLDELFFNEAQGFVTNLEKTLVTGFGNAFHAAGKLLQGAVVKAIVVPALKDNLPKKYADLVVAEELQAAIDDFDNADSAEQASKTIIDYINGLSENSTEIDKLTPEKEEKITEQITEIYNKTVEVAGEGNFSVEAMITVMASEMMGGVGDFNLSDLIAGFAGGGESGTETGGETGGEEKEVKKYSKYRDMGEGLAKSFIGDDFASSIKSMIMNAVGENDAVFGYYGYIFIGVGFFIALWLILFLFAFFHMLAKNKRFMMWYVKLFCAWPCIIFYLIPLLVKKVLATVFPDIYTQVMEFVVNFAENTMHVTITTEQASGLFNSVLSAFQTYAWISGICYLLLWVISICWAFPIKHKIRQLKRDN